MAQPTQRPEIQAFLLWVQKNSEYAIQDPNSEARRAFMPFESIKAYLAEDTGSVVRLDSILAAIFHPEEVLVSSHNILKNYVRIFSILVEIGKGQYIDRFLDYGISDGRLPFLPEDPPPSGFPRVPSGEDSSFYQVFCEKQWRFCAVEFRDTMATKINENLVLPIVSKERIAGGGSATLYKVQLHRSYNHLELQKQYYALKTYFTPDAETYYTNEVHAFHRFRKYDNSGLITFCGSYVQGSSYNLLLEYANQGSLEQYFRDQSPPRAPEDIVSFWKGLFETVGALMCIHNAALDDKRSSVASRVLHGFHQDVKPENILVIGDTSTSHYSWKFKLADLGLSHFKWAIDQHESPVAKDARGTRTYGAPETFRGNSSLDKGSIPVTSGVDIWSLGCIFSEASVWIASGFDGLQKYRDMRAREIERREWKKDGCRFHDGDKVLSSISECHESIIQKKVLSQGDYITTHVMSLVENQLLVPAAQRLNATQLVNTAEKLLQKANRESDSYERNVTSSFGVAKEVSQPQIELPPSPTAPPRPQNRPIQSKATPPKGPRDHNHRYDRNGQQQRMFSGVRREQSPARMRVDDDELSELAGPRATRTRYPPGQSSQPGQYPGKRYSGSRNSSASTGNRTIDQYEPSVSGQSHISEDSSSNFNDEDHYAEEIRANQERHSLPKTKKDPNVLHQYGSNGEQSFRGSRTFSQTPTGNSSATARPWSDAAVPTPRKKQSSQAGTVKPAKSPPPYLSVLNAGEWKSAQKANGSFMNMLNRSSASPSLTDSYLLDRVKGRDHAFLIDDAASMRPHWQDVKGLLGILAYLVKRCDPDKLELRYTINSQTAESKDTKKLLKSIDKTHPEGISDIAIGLAAILEPYRQKLLRNFASGPAISSGVKEDIHKLNLYVFTDGVWQPKCNAGAPITSIVSTLLEHRLPRSQVGIQFIRFGNDRIGIQRLQHLDTLTRQMDIVDTEPSNGNVWKMLLGAIDPWFDDDDDIEDGSDNSNGGPSPKWEG